jgi:hypothetical protein
MKYAAVLILAFGCAANPSHRVRQADDAVVIEEDRPSRQPPVFPAKMSRTDFDAMVANKVLAPFAAQEIEKSSTMYGIEPVERLDATGRRLTLTNAFPGGWSETLYVDAANRVWIVITQNSVRVPEGVIISATRIVRSTIALPDGVTFGGEVRLFDPAPQGPRAPARG